MFGMVYFTFPYYYERLGGKSFVQIDEKSSGVNEGVVSCDKVLWMIHEQLLLTYK